MARPFLKVTYSQQVAHDQHLYKMYDRLVGETCFFLHDVSSFKQSISSEGLDLCRWRQSEPSSEIRRLRKGVCKWIHRLRYSSTKLIYRLEKYCVLSRAMTRTSMSMSRHCYHKRSLWIELFDHYWEQNMCLVWWEEIEDGIIIP